MDDVYPSRVPPGPDRAPQDAAAASWQAPRSAATDGCLDRFALTFAQALLSVDANVHCRAPRSPMVPVSVRALLNRCGVAIGAVACVVLAACGADDAKPADPRKAEFTSLKPGSSAAQPGGAKSAGEASLGAPTAAGANDSAPKVEDSDVVRVEGTKILILNAWRGLQIVEAADPKAPKLIARVPMHGQPREMYVAGGYATIVLGHAYDFATSATTPGAEPFAGTQVRVVQLNAWTDAKEVKVVSVGGWPVATRRIDDRLILVTADTGYWPWWGWCYGPYACMGSAGVAVGGVATKGATEGPPGAASSGDSATPGSSGGSSGSSGSASAGSAGTATSVAQSGGMVADPFFGWGYGASAASGAVVVLDQKDPKATAEIGKVTFTGGAGLAIIEPGEVVVHGSQYGWDAVKQESSRIDRLTQVQIDVAGKPKLGAVDEAKASGNNTWNSQPRGLGRLGTGLFATVSWQGVYEGSKPPKGQITLRTLVADGAKWTTKAQWTAAQDSGWFHTTFAGKLALVSQGAWDTGTTKAAPPSLKVIDLADPATPTQVAEISLAGYVQPAALHPLDSVQPGLWLVAGSQAVAGAKPTPQPKPGADPNPGGETGKPDAVAYQQVLTTLSLASPKQPKELDKLSLPNSFGWDSDGVDVLAGSGLVVTGAANAGGTPSMQLVQVGADGKLTKRGAYASKVARQPKGGSKVANWWQLATLVWEKKLVRASSEHLEIIDIGDLDKPAQLGGLELAANVIDIAVVGTRAVALVMDASGGSTQVRVLKPGSTDEQAPEGVVDVGPMWGRLFSDGNLVFVADGQQVRAVDVSNAAAPKLKGTWVAPVAKDSGWEGFDPAALALKGSVLFAVTTKSAALLGTATQCANQAKSTEVPPSSGGSTPAQPSADPDGQKDGGAAPTPDAGAPAKPSTPAPCIIDWKYTTTVRALDFTAPDKPVVASQLELKDVSGAWGVRLDGTTLHFSHWESAVGKDGAWSGKAYFDRVDVANPKAMKWLGKANVPGNVFALAPGGKTAYSLDWQWKAGTKPEAGQAETLLHVLALDGGKAYLDGSVTLPGHAAAAVLAGKHLYLGTWDYWWALPKADAGKPAPQPKAQLTVVDVSTAAKPKIVAGIATGAAVGRIEVAGTALFLGVGYGGGLQLWDVTQPAAPVYKAFLPAQGWVERVVAAGEAVWLATGMHGIGRYLLGK
ncbi:MAG: hypothetical protein EXR79_10740 [Myxococcales bacterium]|nr:hypothetical protein [Myxococcales bacterium]